MIEGFKSYIKESKHNPWIYSIVVIIGAISFLSIIYKEWVSTNENGWHMGEALWFIGYIVWVLFSSCLMLNMTWLKRKLAELEHDKEQLIKQAEEYRSMLEDHRTFGIIDGMTGIYNRSFGLSFLDQQIKIVKRDGTDLTISYLDINDLKNVNDCYGHRAGDQLIITACNILKENLRESDVLCRMGGDEFLMILPNCSLGQADLVINRVNSQIESFNRKSLLPYKLSISIGVATFCRDTDMDIEELIHEADTNMYDHKRRDKGKKEVVMDE